MARLTPKLQHLGLMAVVFCMLIGLVRPDCGLLNGCETVLRCALLAIILTTPAPTLRSTAGVTHTLADWLLETLWPVDAWAIVSLGIFLLCRCVTGLLSRVLEHPSDLLTVAWVCWQHGTVLVALVVARHSFMPRAPARRAPPAWVVAIFVLWTVLDARCSPVRDRPPAVDWREMVLILTQPTAPMLLMSAICVLTAIACWPAGPDRAALQFAHSAVRYSALLLSHRVTEAFLCWAVWCDVAAAEECISIWLSEGLPKADSAGLSLMHQEVRRICRSVEPLLNYLVIDRVLHLLADVQAAWKQAAVEELQDLTPYSLWRLLLPLIPHVMYTLLVGSALLRTAQFNHLSHRGLVAKVMDMHLEVSEKATKGNLREMMEYLTRHPKRLGIAVLGRHVDYGWLWCLVASAALPISPAPVILKWLRH
eukprot:TRINITY_DN29632_c0_g2_i1.p1 TRINITY_DN29632_c0_g2~~TRINITY_DN29632_c0_g2_i1.p1  ORF type:complete len:423 (+),score=25.29 TRINITY_DN29632_c0_g2_i1:176-1444(+)